MGTKRVQWLLTILKNLGFQVSDAPTSIYEYSQPTIYIIRENHLTIRVNHIDVPIHDVHEKYVLLNIYPVRLKTTIQTADIGTTSFTGPLLEYHYSYICGARYYPSPDSNNYLRLALDTLHTSYHPTAPSKYL